MKSNVLKTKETLEALDNANGGVVEYENKEARIELSFPCGCQFNWYSKEQKDMEACAKHDLEFTELKLIQTLPSNQD